jgi:ribosomal protein S20
MTNATIIGKLAIKEHAAWRERNDARSALRTWLKVYRSNVEEPYDDEGAEPEDRAAFNQLRKEADIAQRVLTTARAATRRAVLRYHRDSPEALEARGQERLL